MRDKPSLNVEFGRILDGPFGSSIKDGCNGAFLVYHPALLKIIATDGTDPDAEGWEHVSVSLRKRTPTWEEMAWVKDQFWMPEEACFQLHPSQDDYVNHHPYCLHIWRHKVLPTPRPNKILVGPK